MAKLRSILFVGTLVSLVGCTVATGSSPECPNGWAKPDSLSKCAPKSAEMTRLHAITGPTGVYGYVELDTGTCSSSSGTCPVEFAPNLRVNIVTMPPIGSCSDYPDVTEPPNPPTASVVSDGTGVFATPLPAGAYCWIVTDPRDGKTKAGFAGNVTSGSTTLLRLLLPGTSS